MRLIDADKLLTKAQDYGEGQEKLILIDPYYVKKAETVQAIPILDNATNGDVIKASLKPYILQISEDYELSKKVRVAIGVGTPILEFDIKWWIAPYKRGDEA